MADTPRVTVPVDGAEVTITLTGKVSDTMPDRPGWFRVTGHKFIFSATGDDAAIRLSAAPAPEGGAVNGDALKIATDLHKAFEQLIYGLPKYLEAENLTDEENMIREAWITLDVTAHRIAALATREEAPAEAGEDMVRIPRRLAESARRLLSGNGLHVQADKLDAALRAQPQAREEAQPVGWVSPAALQAAQKGETCFVWPRKTDAFPVAIYTHPAPDALRAERDEWRDTAFKARSANTEAKRKLAEAEETNTRWALRFVELRKAAGIGVKPMLSEVPDELRKMRSLLDRAADLMRQCTDPERFEGASTLNVYANMRAWLSDLSKEAERG